jgi:hypothetical protein
MKRKNTGGEAVAYCTRSKKPKLLTGQVNVNIDYIAATSTRNYMLNDSLVDWLKTHKKHTHHTRKSTSLQKGKGFSNFIMERGIDFEDKLIDYINKHRLSVVTVSERITDESVKKTIDLMKIGTPVIHSAPFRNKKNRTHGVIDLLIRSDFVGLLVNENPLTDEEMIIPATKLNHKFHYVVVDVKFSTLPLRADSRHILNSGSYPAYKSQCLIYTNAISQIQGYTSPYSFILGRRYKYMQKDTKYNSFSCLDKLGVIDYTKEDKLFVQQTKNAIRWVRDNKKFGHTWSIDPPSRQELYPNMCHDSGKWQKQKEKIADNIGEITSIWYCGIKHRKNGIKNGITSWRDTNCNSNNMGIGGVRAPIIDSILYINRQNNDKILPKLIKNNVHNWKKSCNEIFVDFETLSDIFSSFNELPKQSHTDMIFMIGIWYKKNNIWTYKRLTCNKATYDEEFRIMDEFNTFLHDQKSPKLWYWYAEDTFWKRSEDRQYDIANRNDDNTRMNQINIWNIGVWKDMCDIFKKEPIVIKDCFKFGLKQIAKAMYKHNLIKTSLDSKCTSGMMAMVNALKCYEDQQNPATCNVMKDIAKYNKFDVCVLEDILTYLRQKHT